MKVLFDCIVTKDPIHKCSSTVMFIRTVPKLLEDPNTFIYWPIPEWVKDVSGLPSHPRIKYFRVHQSKDRTREYNVIRPWLEEALSFAGPLWDWDVLVTSRTAQVPFMKVMAVSPRQNNRNWSKRVVLVEEMAILTLKPTVLKSDGDIQDRMTLEGYLAADYVLSPSYHEKGMALEIARRHFSPARQKDLRDGIKEACALSTGSLTIKPVEYRWDSKASDRKLVLVFAGRLESTAARLALIGEVFKNQFIMNGDKVEPKILSVSAPGCRGEEAFDKHSVEILHLDRDDFWKMSRERMDLAMYFHVDGGLLMSIFEPVSFGVPAIVKDAPWSRSVFGPTYPLYATSETQAYGLVNMFIEDYAGMYAKFSEWYTSWFVPEYTRRMTEDNLFTLLAEAVMAPPKPEGLNALKDNEVVSLLLKHGGEEFKMFEVLEKISKIELNGLGAKLKENFDDRGLAWGTPWNDFRLGLVHHHGYVDASIEVGHLKKAKVEA